jgi:hypothetical protein
MILPRKNKSTHGAAFFSAVRSTPWDDAAPLGRVLEVTLSPAAATLTLAHARALWKELSYLGSNDLAYLLRRLQGVDYPEIVRDVCKYLKISELQPGEEESVVELNEQLVIRKIFADAWEHIDADERRELLGEMKLDGVALGPVGWLASGASLLTDVTSPALRKTVPAVRPSEPAPRVPETPLARAPRATRPAGPAHAARSSTRCSPSRTPARTPR